MQTASARAIVCSRSRVVVLALATAVGLVSQKSAGSFTDVTAFSGLDYLQNASPRDNAAGDYDIETGGAAARDFDGDGWTDLIVSRFDNTPILYRNVRATTGVGRRFVDVTADSGLEVRAHLNGLGWADVNRDGRPDLYATSKAHRHYLFINKGNGKFAEEAVSRGADLSVPSTSPLHGGMSVAFGDYDRDGYSDIAVGNWLSGNPSDPNAFFQVLRNRGAAAPGHFEQTTYSAGLNVSVNTRRFAFTPRFTDLDNDGWLDMALCSDAGNAKLFWNNRDGTFTDGTTAAHTGTESAAMGNTVGDFDRDGDLDWFVSSTYGNRLYRNRTTRAGTTGESRVFSDATDLGRTGVRQGGWGWGASFIDYDLDGWQDLVQTNGMYNVDRTMLWHNTGKTGALGFDDASLANGMMDSKSGKGLVVFDYDNDGAPDVFIVNNRDRPILYHNDYAGTAQYLKLQLLGDPTLLGGSNPDAFGAVVTLSDPLLGPDLMLELSGGSNYLGQNDTALLFGLGSFKDTIDVVTIRWPNGLIQKFYDVAPDMAYRATEGADRLYPLAIVPEPSSLLLVGAVAAWSTQRGCRRQ